MKKYNKLVRDNIPEIIKKNCDVAICHTATNEEYELALHAKLKEEVEEFMEDESVGELADIIEVIHEIIAYHNFTLDEVEKERLEKKKKRGGFQKRIILDSTN